MRILFLNWKDIQNPAAGGAELMLFELARRFARDSHAVTLFTRRFPQCKTDEIIEGIRVIRRGNRWSVYWRAFGYYQRLAQPPDIVVDMVNTLPWFTPWYVPRPRRVLFVFQLAQAVFFYHLPPLVGRLAYMMERLFYLPYQNTTAIAISKSTRDDLISYGLPAAHISIAHPGLDHQRYHPGPSKTAFPLFVFVGRLVKMKRAGLCIEAMRLVVDHYPATKLIIIGQGPEKQALLSRINHLGLSKNVFSLSNKSAGGAAGSPPAAFLNEPDKISLLQQAWALLLPSVKEGWGMAVTEAAAAGTPAIVSNVSGLRDCVINSKTGLIGPASPTPQALAELMLRLIEDPPLRQRLARGALAWSEEFDWEKSYQNIHTILSLIPGREV